MSPTKHHGWVVLVALVACTPPWWLRDSADPPEGVCEPGFVPRGTSCYPVAMGAHRPLEDAGSWVD